MVTPRRVVVVLIWVKNPEGRGQVCELKVRKRRLKIHTHTHTIKAWLGKDKALGMQLLKEQNFIGNICSMKKPLAVSEAETLESTERKRQKIQRRD